jgi:hypothetical protein
VLTERQFQPQRTFLEHRLEFFYLQKIGKLGILLTGDLPHRVNFHAPSPQAPHALCRTQFSGGIVYDWKTWGQDRGSAINLYLCQARWIPTTAFQIGRSPVTAMTVKAHWKQTTSWECGNWGIGDWE